MTDMEAQLAESRRLSMLLVRHAEQAKADFAEAVAPYGLPVHLARALLILAEPTPMFAVADQLACDRSYVTGLADGLEERGLVTRVAGEDRRIKMLATTEAGDALRRNLATAATERSAVMRKLDDEERRVLASIVARLVEP